MAWTDATLTAPTNPTFASSTTGWTPANTEGSWTNYSLDGHDDGKSAMLVCASNVGWRADTSLTSGAVTLPVGAPYALRCWYRIVNGGALDKTVVTFRVINATGSTTVASTLMTNVTSVVWVPILVPFIVPASGSVKARVIVKDMPLPDTGMAAQYPLLIDDFGFWTSGGAWSPDTPPTGDWTVS